MKHSWLGGLAATVLSLFLCSCGGSSNSPSAPVLPNKPLITAPVGTTIVEENKKPGDASWVVTHSATPHHIEGYASATSVNRGGSIKLFVNTIYPSYNIDIFRMGWYGGAGARRIMPTVTRVGTKQVLPTPDPVTGFAEAIWTDPYTVSVPGDADPTNWCSGVYLAKLTAGGEQSFILFVVKDELRHSNIFFQVTDTTYQAYNNWLGKSLYANQNPDNIAARRVSYNRPNAREDGTGLFFSWEYAMIRFLEREGYDVSYFSDIDTHQNPSLLKNHEAFMNAGHDEYWTWQMLDAVQAARNSGTNLVFASANNAFWQIRLEPSTVDGTVDRTIVGYKEVAATQDPFALDGDASNDKFVTDLFAKVGRREEDFVGLRYFGQNLQGEDMIVKDASSWVFAGTNVNPGDRIPGVIGGELEKVTQFSPPGAVVLAHSPVVTTTGQNEISDMVVYNSTGGAVTFAAGNFTMSWGLDSYRFDPKAAAVPVSPQLQQMMRNILDRMRQHF